MVASDSFSLNFKNIHTETNQRRPLSFSKSNIPLGNLLVESVTFVRSPKAVYSKSFAEESMKRTNEVIDTILEILGLECQQISSYKYLVPSVVKLEKHYIRGHERLYLTKDVDFDEELFTLDYYSFINVFDRIMCTKITQTLETFIEEFINHGNSLPEQLEEITIIASTPSYEAEEAKEQCDVTQLMDVIEPHHKLKFIFKELYSLQSKNILVILSSLREEEGVQVHVEFTNRNKDVFILHCSH